MSLHYLKLGWEGGEKSQEPRRNRKGKWQVIVRGKFLREHKAQELDILALEVRGDKKH